VAAVSEGDGKRLVVLLGGRRVGVVVEDGHGRLSLSYDDEWRSSSDAVPVSLPMPLATRTHPDPTVRAFLWGLLPVSEQVLERWARTYQVSAGNPFGHPSPPTRLGEHLQHPGGRRRPARDR
jgi:serine/threonine-protein kinase HipA